MVRGLPLGFMILSKDLVPDKPHESLCGKCDKCIENCPTKAIVEPFVIKSDLCIAYHTIENREKYSKEHRKEFKWVGCGMRYLSRCMSLE